MRWLIMRKRGLLADAAVAREERGAGEYVFRWPSRVWLALVRLLAYSAVLVALALQLLPVRPESPWQTATLLLVAAVTVELVIRGVTRLSIFDKHGSKVGGLRLSLLRRGGTIERGGMPFAGLRRRRGRGYVLRVPGDVPISLSGDFAGHSYEFNRDGETVAWVASYTGESADSFVLGTEEGTDAMLTTASVVALELIHRPRWGLFR